HGPGEKGVLGAGHPAGETLTRIIEAAELEVGATQSSRPNRFAGAGMDDVPLIFEIDDFVGGDFGIGEAAFATDAREDRRQAVVVCRAPALGRMMMALRAWNSHAEKRLSHRLDVIGGLAHGAIPDCRRVFILTAASSENFRGEPVVRLIGGNRIADPAG